ncbi:MAG TPA: LuxR family transcriptional regulator [Solirubrobacteraceae bacterium]|nr:LuxR family transcriptional regulator [Solirubrobacteraceae bacterium]
MLLGRASEREALEELLDAVRNGQSRALTLRGEPGVGKTALLEHVVGAASDFRITRAFGVEAEMELPFAALQGLCAPILDRLDRLPEPQRAAMGSAFGLSSGPPPEQLLVGLAALSLLADASRDLPLLCVIDDAQWLDRASAQALAFLARRLLADRVAVLFATRGPSQELAGLSELSLQGLDGDAASALLATVIAGPLDERVRNRIVTETHGNPLALLELPRGRTPAELALGFGVSASVPLTGRIEAHYRQRILELPDETQLLLLIAALAPLGEPETVRRAGDRLDVSAGAAQPGVTSGLLEANLEFHHPLVRSAVSRAAPAEQRRQVHLALAEVTDATADPDHRAWHRAQAAAGPDEDVAEQLERAAGRAQQRGGRAAAAALLERSAELTPQPQRRALRSLLAAHAQLMAGASDRAQALLDQALPNLTDTPLAAQAMRMQGVIRFSDGRGGETPSLLFQAAMGLKSTDPQLAREVLMEAFEAAMWAGRLTSGTTALAVARAARGFPAPDGNKHVGNLLLSAYSARLTQGYASAVEGWRRAIAAHIDELGPQLKWDGLVWNATGELLDYEAHYATARTWARVSRAQGALATLPGALNAQAWCEVLAGRIEAAEALVAEAEEIASATGAPATPGASEILKLGILCWRGDERKARPLAESVAAEALARGQGLGMTIVEYMLTILELGLGRYEEARVYALRVFAEDVLWFGSAALADAVEAAVRAGDKDAARAALTRLSERASASRTPWGLGLLARAQALLASDEAAEPLLRESLDHLGRSGLATELARTHLLYGEWLRRVRRRRDARVHLRAAHQLFEAMGAGAFAHRAGVELLATGEHARVRAPDTRDQLTPQEQQIARLAAEGESNAQIAAQLFISPHTVAYHLHKVFGKLNVTSRNQLSRALGDQLAPAPPYGNEPRGAPAMVEN